MSGTRVEDLLGPLNAVERKFAPPVLWTLGHADLLRQHPRVAVVGTRNPTKEGAHRATRLVRELVAARAVVVSGLAAGIDTIAHTQTIDLGGRTIAVIGTPVDDVFPRANERLQQRIVRDHLAVSELAPGPARRPRQRPVTEPNDGADRRRVGHRGGRRRKRVLIVRSSRTTRRSQVLAPSLRGPLHPLLQVRAMKVCFPLVLKHLSNEQTSTSEWVG